MSIPGVLRRRRARRNTSMLLRVYLLVGAVVLAVGLLIYFHSLARRVEAQTEAMSEVVANVLAAGAMAAADPGPQIQGAVRSLNFPVIITDVSGRPLAWNRHVGVDTLSIDRLIAEDLTSPSPELARVLGHLRRMDAQHDPVGMYLPGEAEPQLLLHYGSPGLSAELRWTPWVTISVAALFGLVGLFMLRGLKRAEEGFIWAGMAKETAHQMGTPLSSLSGWMEVMQDEVSVEGERAVIPRELFDEVVSEVGRDTERLNRVAARFSQIGSRPNLVSQPVDGVVRSTVDYFRRRFPQGVALELDMQDDLPAVRLNAELLGWVLENLLKNAMNAAKARGAVRVRVARDSAGEGIEIRVRDDGKGVEAGMEKQIFRPGVSTRTRGWGLGLPLSRRIVEDYHGGRLDLVWTEPGRGAEFRVLLPAEPA